MKNYIEVNQLVKKLKSKKVDLGKGDPYNRLRYYTKIGWLPHMERKQAKSGSVKGHYPVWVLSRLILIDDLKKRGFSNKEIGEKINTRTKLQDLYTKVNSPRIKSRITTYLILILLIFILLSELGVINISKPKNTTVVLSEFITILDSGNSTVPLYNDRTFIRSAFIDEESKIYVTFTQDYSPANRYWVGEIEPGKGFYLRLDAPVKSNSDFSWWISN
ncbi:hypothetical protein ACFL13_00615 [Patescibacteria group bacterium]